MWSNWGLIKILSFIFSKKNKYDSLVRIKLKLFNYGFKNVSLIAITDHNEEESLNSGKTSFLKIKSETEYYERKKEKYNKLKL